MSSSSSSSLGSNFMQRSLSSPALHLLTSQLHSPTSSSPQNSSTSQPSSSSLSAASPPPPSAPSPSPSSSVSSLTRSRSSRRRQSLTAGHHLSDVQEGAPSPRKKSPLSLVDQRFSPYDRSQPQPQDQSNFSSFSSVGASPGADSFSSRGGASDRRFRSVGLAGTGGSTSGGSVDEFGVRSYEQTPPLSLTGSSSQRSTSSLGEMEYQPEEAYRYGLGVTGFDVGGGGRSESEGTECGRSSDRLQLEDVLEGDVYESPGREQSTEGRGSGRESIYGQHHHQPGLMSPFLPSAPATPSNVASPNSTYHDSSYPPQPPPLPSLGSPYSTNHYSHPSHQQQPQDFLPDLGRRSLPSPSHHSPSYLPHIRTTVSYPTDPNSHTSPSYRSPPLTSPYSTGAYSHSSHIDPNLVASPTYPLESPRHLLSSSSTASYPPTVGGPPPGYARVELDLTTIPTSLVLPPPKEVEEEKPAPLVATTSTLKTSASNSTLHAPTKPPSRPSASSNSRPEGSERGIPAAVVLPSEVALAKAEAVQAARTQKGVRIKQKLTNEDKLEIILSHDNDPTLTQQESATKYGVDRSTISKITNNRERWLNPQISPIVVKDPTKTDFRPLGGRFVRAETQTNEWLDAQFLAGVTVEDMQIRDQAVIFHNTDRGHHEKEFRGSTKWLHSFKERRRLAKTWLAAPVPPGTSPPVASSSAVKMAVPSSLSKKQPSIAIASPTPKRPNALVINSKRLSYSQEAPPMTATSSTSSFGGASSSSSSSSIFSPHHLQSSFSSRGSSPSVVTSALPLAKLELDEQPASSLPPTSFSSLRIRSQSSPNIHNSEDRPSTAPATKRPSSGKVAKPRPTSMHRGTSFNTISELRGAGSPSSSRPQSPRSVGLSRSSTCRSPAASSSSGSSRSSSSLAGRRSLGPGFEFTPLEPRPIRLSSQVSPVNEFGMQMEQKPQIGYDSTYEQYLRPEEEVTQQQHVYPEDGGGRAVEARSLGTFTSNLGDLSLSSRSEAMSRQSSGGGEVAGSERGYYQPQYYRPDLSPTSTTTSSLYQPPSDASYGYLQHSQSEPASYTTYSYLPPAEEQFYPQQQFHRQPNHLPLQQHQHHQQPQDLEQYSYQQHYPAPPPLPHHFQQQSPQSYAPLQPRPSPYETPYAPPYASTPYGYEPAQAPPQMYHSPYQSQGGSVNPSEMHHRRVEDDGAAVGGWMASS